MSKTLLVTGATGNQGGALINAILNSPSANDFTILAVTRDPSSTASQKLASRSVKLIRGDLKDMPALFKSATTAAPGPLYGVFSVQVPMGKGQNVKTEEAYGKQLIDESLKAGVKHFVYTSVERGGDEKSWSNPTPVPHFISKHNIELHLRDAATNEMGWTILRPVAFMDNFQPGCFQFKVFLAAWRDTLREKPLQLIAASDIGYVGAQALLKPDEYNHRAIGLAGDSINFAQLNTIFQETLGFRAGATFSILGSALKYGVSDIGKMLDWFSSDGYGVDILRLRSEYPKLLDVKEWLATKSAFEKKN